MPQTDYAPPQSLPEPAPIYLDLRDMVLKLSPAEVSFTPRPENPSVWGILMETGYPKAAVTLIALADGATSLYFSTGGGMIGCGQHAAVAQASRDLLTMAERYQPGMRLAKDFPLPKTGQVIFYLLTTAGVYTAEASEQALGSQQPPLSPLFYGGHEVITQIRLLQGAHDLRFRQPALCRLVQCPLPVLHRAADRPAAEPR